MILSVYIMVIGNNLIYNNKSFLWCVLHSLFLVYAGINRKKFLNLGVNCKSGHKTLHILLSRGGCISGWLGVLLQPVE